MPDICQIHLGRDGLQEVSTSQALADFKSEIANLAVRDAGLVLDANAIAKHSDALKRLRTQRFYSFRDMSSEQLDVRSDSDYKRRGRWLSLTRDVMTGHAWDGAHGSIVHELGTMPGGYPGRDSVPFFGRKSASAGVDTERFLVEVDKLITRRILDPKDFPVYDSDESMHKLLGKVNDLAHEDARSRRVDLGNSNRVIDAAPGLYLFSELLKRTEKLIEEDFTELWARRIFAIRNLNTWLPQWSFQRIDDRTTLPEYAQIERLSSNAQRGHENRDAELRNLAFYVHAAAWSKLELMRYAEATANGAPGIDISKRRINNAIRMMNFKEDMLTFAGDDDVDILGLFSDAAETGIERVVAAPNAFGVGGPEDDRNLLINTVTTIIENTEQVLAPDTIMLSTNSWLHVNKTLYGSVDSDAGSNKTVLEMAEQTLRKLGIKDILWVPEVGYSASQEKRLEAHGLSNAEAKKYAGGDGNGKQDMVVCNRSAEVMEMVIAKDRSMYPSSEERTDRIETRMIQGSGGLAVYKPAGVKIVVNVGPANV